MQKKNLFRLMVRAIICISALLPLHVFAAQYKVLVVQSYEETMPWVREINEGIEKILKDRCEIRYFYMDTKSSPEKGPQKAEAAFALYQEFQPHGVIVGDDNGQSMFVLPYLKDRVTVPVMFCGVNAEAEKYGYPAAHISGILERHHFKEMIAFAKQFDPSVKTFAYMIKKSPVGEIILKQIEKEQETYSAKFVGYRMPETIKEAKAMAAELSQQCDLLLLSTLTGLKDDGAGAMPDKEAVPPVAEAFGKMVVGTEEQVLKTGALCSVIRTGQEQGAEAAKMLLKAMEGTPVSEIPVIRNRNGKRMINISVMKEMDITPRPEVLRGAQLVKTE